MCIQKKKYAGFYQCLIWDGEIPAMVIPGWTFPLHQVPPPILTLAWGGILTLNPKCDYLVTTGIPLYEALHISWEPKDVNTMATSFAQLSPVFVSHSGPPAAYGEPRGPTDPSCLYPLATGMHRQCLCSGIPYIFSFKVWAGKEFQLHPWPATSDYHWRTVCYTLSLSAQAGILLFQGAT